MFLKKENIICGGVVKDGYLEGYSEIINSKTIISFEYTCGRFYVKCDYDNDKIHVISDGGYSNERDGNYFKLDYKIDNDEIFKELQKIVEKNNISENNGYEHETAGLPPGLGDTIKIEYENGERIYKYSNQRETISEEAQKDIYNLFHKYAKKENLDFNSDGSNVKLYDDADKDFIQGKWKGKHFGDEIEVEFNDNHIKILVNNELTDDTDYIIYEGNIRPNKLKEGKQSANNKNDYEEFIGVSSIRKKNEIMLVAYFTKNSYSTADLIKQK